MTGRPSRRTRNGAEARAWRAMPRHSVVERSRIPFSMRIILGDCSSRGRKHCKFMEKCTGWGASPAIRFMGQGDKAARAFVLSRYHKSISSPLYQILSYTENPPNAWHRQGRQKHNKTRTSYNQYQLLSYRTRGASFCDDSLYSGHISLIITKMQR